MMASGVLFLDKPVGWTSRKAVNMVTMVLSEKGGRLKAGHAGTLDPLASGMLAILVGEATRFADYGLSAAKTYRVCLDLSIQTDTLDKEGRATATFDPPRSGMVPADIERVLQGFVGRIKQVPPAFSAVRVGGKRAYDLARAGEQPSLKARCVEIKELRLEHFAWPRLTLYVECSKGTYIRSLARDIGCQLGLGGCVLSLRRLSTGGWGEDMMVTPERLQAGRWDCVLPLEAWLAHLPRCELDEEQSRRFIHGQRLPVDNVEACELAVFHGGRLLGTARARPGLRGMVLHPLKVLHSARECLT